jgi:hypothetical protein
MKPCHAPIPTVAVPIVGGEYRSILTEFHSDMIVHRNLTIEHIPFDSGGRSRQLSFEFAIVTTNIPMETSTCGIFAY